MPSKGDMDRIDKMTVDAITKRHAAVAKERMAISIIEHALTAH
jgi:hypothetical protein